MGVSYRIYFVGVLNIGEKLNKSPIAKIKSSPINLPVRYLAPNLAGHTQYAACSIVQLKQNDQLYIIIYVVSYCVTSLSVLMLTMALRNIIECADVNNGVA